MCRCWVTIALGELAPLYLSLPLPPLIPSFKKKNPQPKYFGLLINIIYVHILKKKSRSSNPNSTFPKLNMAFKRPTKESEGTRVGVGS